MIYSADDSKELYNEKARVLRRLSFLTERFALEIANRIEKPRAREYLLEGACRRLNVLRRCMSNVFEIFPPMREARLSKDELSNIEINLHANFVNAYGFFDNLAWVCVFASEADSQLSRTEVGLWSKNTQLYLPKTLRDAAQLKEVKQWRSLYAKNFRDALAHRVPPYVPPYQLTPEQRQTFYELEQQVREAVRRGEFDRASELQDDQDRLGSVCAWVAHSYSDDDGSPPVALHPQMLTDANTVVMVGNAYADSFPAGT